MVTISCAGVATTGATGLVGGGSAAETKEPSVLALAQTAPAPVLDDPLYQYQWHLKNTGQRVFGDTLPTAGIDLNIGTLHERGITGKGIVVELLESGRVDVDHEDLAANLFARDPISPAQADPHATSMAGIIAAVARNGKGGRGVAPEATIVDHRAPAAAKAPRPRLYNVSGACSLTSFNPYRWSKKPGGDLNSIVGPAVIKAAGNDFLSGQNGGPDAEQCRDMTRGTGIGCLTAVAEETHAYSRLITVGAINASGKKASYSKSGSVLWVSGLGGEHGDEKALASTGLSANQYDPAILTTDITGPDFGLSGNRLDKRPRNRLDRGRHSRIDATGNYTAIANGTSSATPTVTGVAALMLQVNPALTWRDVKYILATTARKIDPEQGKIDYQGLRLDDGWVTNAAGRPFSNWYGFGLVDATAAVEAASHYTPLGPLRDSGWLVTEAIGTPVALATTPQPQGAPIVFSDDVTIETIQLRLRTNHAISHGLQIQLTSPSGTKSIILPALTYLKDRDGEFFSIDLAASNAFLDESARGTWTLHAIDVMNRTPRSTLISWELRVWGH
jgi:subtilisin family serine protease